MSLIRPFRGLRPAQGRADEVVAPPYDVLNSEEARERATGKPWSFLHISKPEIDLPAGTDPYDPSVYAKAAENFQRTIDAEILVRDEQPSYYAYRIIMDGHQQTGLVAAASVKDYDSNRIRKHEFTRPKKEDDRVRQIEAVNAQTGPVLLAYPDSPEVDKILSEASNGQPVLDVTADDGVQHSLWVIDDQSTIDQLTALFEAMQAIYIADGHHRSASASRVNATRGGNADASDGAFLSVIYPYHEMKILDYNRVIKDLNGLSAEDLLDKLKQNFTVEPRDSSISPEVPAAYGMYLEEKWYRLALKPELIPENDPVGRLDVSLLATYLIEPLFDITDPRTDERIDFVGGIRGMSELERRVDAGEMAIAFSLHPTRMEDLMSVADANEVMPPKSTWFEPKLADGLVSHLLD